MFISCVGAGIMASRSKTINTMLPTASVQQQPGLTCVTNVTGAPSGQGLPPVADGAITSLLVSRGMISDKLNLASISMCRLACYV